MRLSSEILERVAVLLFGLVIVTGLSRAASQHEPACPRDVRRSGAGSSATVSPVAESRALNLESDAVLRDMLLHD